MKKETIGYSDYLFMIKNKGAPIEEPFVRIPLGLIVDDVLTEKEKRIWMILASFQYKHDSPIFPNRRTLSKLMNLKTHESVSRITARMQDKGYLEKGYQCNPLNIKSLDVVFIGF